MANADAIAALLSSVNPNWPLAEMQSIHLEATDAEALARKTQNYAADVTAFDRVHLQILEMADMLTEGIVKQFPNMFSSCSLKDDGQKASNDIIVLNQNTPNPFNDKTVISYFMPGNIKREQILIYDVMVC